MLAGVIIGCLVFCGRLNMYYIYTLHVTFIQHVCIAICIFRMLPIMTEGPPLDNYFSEYDRVSTAAPIYLYIEHSCKLTTKPRALKSGYP